MKAVDRELKFERKDFLKLPEVMDFACSTEGAVATFSRKFGSEDIIVTMDANSAVEMDMMGEEYDSSEVRIFHLYRHQLFFAKWGFFQNACMHAQQGQSWYSIISNSPA